MRLSTVALRTIETQLWCVVIVVVVAMVADVASLDGPNVCMVKQKYNITKRVKYRAPMSVRTYVWCFSVPPRCSHWSTEIKDLTRLETEERTAEVAVCCPGYKMKDVSCVPICPHGKTGPKCSDDCPPHKWGPNCVNNCTSCADHGTCSPVTGKCECEEGWQGESCEIRMPTTPATTTMKEEILTTTKSTINTNSPPTTGTSIIRNTVNNASTLSSTIVEMTTLKKLLTSDSSSKSTSTTITFPITTTSAISVSRTNRHPLKEPATSERTVEVTVRNNVIDYTTEWGNPNESIQSTVTSNKATPTSNVKHSTTSFVTTPTSETTMQDTTITRVIAKTIYNRTEPSIGIETTTPFTTTVLPSSTKNMRSEHVASDSTTDTKTGTTPGTVQTINNFISTSQSNGTSNEKESLTKADITRKPESTVRTSTTTKLKPKEIWIKPTQKEPEHITAVMSEKERDRSSMDLISVVSIAGGVMMAIITVAVMIVMVERCRRPRFDDLRKVNDIRMQVMIDNSDVPPPYTRSIFHTPLPEPPPSEKCHYQPISTLDRNLKQFMRPVVVQSISPIMLENFRGILECHYDHLPRRNHDFGTMPTRLVSAPSMSYSQELRSHKSRSVNDSAIDAMRCEAKLDIIDSTTSEPLYAEIPCWRPPSEHAVEVVNGEAITEL